MASPAKTEASFDRLPVGAKVLLLFLILGVVSAVYYFALHMSLSDSIDAARSRYGQLQQEQQEAEQRRQDFLRLSEELRDREAIDRQNKRVLPEQAEIAAFLQDLNRLAELSGLGIRLVEPRPEEAEELYVRVPVSLSVVGRFHQVARFFNNVSRLERAINMEDVKLVLPESSASADGSDQDEEFALTIDVLATTFRRPSADELAAASAEGEVVE